MSVKEKKIRIYFLFIFIIIIYIFQKNSIKKKTDYFPAIQQLHFT